MSVLVIAAIGVAVVLISILAFRLHPLLALLLGSLFLLAATPLSIQQHNVLESKISVVRGLAGSGLVGLERSMPAGEFLLWQSDELLENAPRLILQRALGAELARAEQRGELTPMNLVWYSTSEQHFVLTKGAKLISAADVRDLNDERWTGLGGRLSEGFAKTFRKLGIPVTMAAIVGVCLLESGAAARLVAAIMSLFGPRGTAPALTVSGFILGVPVFFDNVFYLLLPLAKAAGRARPEKFLTAVMAIIVGATMAHSLVPPTPGPLFVAGQFGVSLGMMMAGGVIVGGIAACVGFAYGVFCNRWLKLSPDQVSEGEIVAVDANARLPLWLAAVPIALPIMLLGGSEVVTAMAKARAPTSRWVLLSSWTSIASDPSLVFIGAALVSLAILRFYGRSDRMGKSIAKGVSDAGTIVLLTSAGGAFGASLQQLQIADEIGNRFGGAATPWGLLLTAFFLTTIIRAAQGSATVAMLTSSTILVAMMEQIELPFHPLYVALAVGCGSKPLPWMNDSGFWQVATMTGMTTGQTLKTFSVALTLMGITGFAVTLLGAWLIPLI